VYGSVLLAGPSGTLFYDPSGMDHIETAFEVAELSPLKRVSKRTAVLSYGSLMIFDGTANAGVSRVVNLQDCSVPNSRWE